MAMTRDEVSRIAAQCGIRFAPMPCGGAEDPLIGACNFNEFVRFAELVAKAEREACAKACEEIEDDRWNLYKGRKPYTGAEHGRASAHTQGESCGASACADAIRARGGD